MISCKDLKNLHINTGDYIIYSCHYSYLCGQGGLFRKTMTLEELGVYYKQLKSANIHYSLLGYDGVIKFYGAVDEYKNLYEKMDIIEKILAKIQCNLIIEKYRQFTNVIEYILDKDVREFIKTILEKSGYTTKETTFTLEISGW